MTIVLIFGAILLAAYLNTREHAEKSWAYAKEWVVKALKMVVYFVPCLVFWVIKQLYAQPIGNYAAGEYNSFSLRKTLGYPKSLLDSVLNTVDYWIDNASAVCGSIVTAIVFAVLTYAIYRVIKNRKEDNQEERFVPILIGGAWMFVCGKGKGALEYWVAVVKPGRVLFEISGVPEDVAKEALRLATHKLPCKCKIVSRADLEGGESNEN